MDQQINILGQLEGVLIMEREALGGRNIDQLNTAVRNKQSLLEHLEHAVLEFYSIIDKIGFAPTAAGVAACVDHFHLTPLWRDLSSRTARCRTSNQTNGGAIELIRASNENLLNLLRGGESSDLFYEASGVARYTIHNSNEIAKA